MFRAHGHLATAMLFGIATIAGAAAPASQRADSATAEVVARSDSSTLTTADVRDLLANVPAASRTRLGSDLGELEQLVRGELLRRSALAAAKTEGFDHQASTLSELATLQDSLIVRLWLASKAAVPAGYPSEADIKAAYESNKRALTAPAQYRLAQIFISAPDGAEPTQLVAALKKTQEIAAKLTAANFSKMAQEYSEHAESAAKGGELGFLREDRMIPQIAAVARTMKSDEVVGPVKSAQGLHFLKLEERKEGTAPSIAEVHDQLADALRARRASELQQAYLKDLGTKSGVTINQIALAGIQSGLK